MHTGLQIDLTVEHNLSSVLQTAGYIYSKSENTEYKYILFVVTARMFHNSFREVLLVSFSCFNHTAPSKLATHNTPTLTFFPAVLVRTLPLEFHHEKNILI